MCRAVWVVIVAADPARTARLRRAVGPEAQVVDVVASPEAIDPAVQADVVVVDAQAADAAVDALGARSAAVLWVGPGAPAAAHHSVAYDEDLEHALPGAITKALIARNASGRTT